MLSRTASCVFWMARYMERAENLARLLDVSQQLALQPRASVSVVTLPLEITGLMQSFEDSEKAINAEEVAHFLVLQASNPSSIYSCLCEARANAHVVRGSITSELWESLNSTWLEMRLMNRAKLRRMGLSRFLDWVKERSHLYRGITFGTSQRNDAFHFARLGTYLERADNTTRLLRFHWQEWASPDETGQPQYYAWAALLRSLSAFEAYRDSYSDSLTMQHIGELLMLREDLPRSLHACFAEMHQILGQISSSQGHEGQRLVAEVYARLRYARWEAVFAVDPMAAFDQLLTEISRVGDLVRDAYWEVS